MKIDASAYLPVELVKKISSFFFTWSACRGIDPNTPLGEIAKHAHLHWQNYEHRMSEMRQNVQTVMSTNSYLRDEVNSLKSKLKDSDEHCHYLVYRQKYKRCLVYIEKHKLQVENAQDAVRLISCNSNAFTEETFRKSLAYHQRKRDRYLKHYNKWLELSRFFKEM